MRLLIALLLLWATPLTAALAEGLVVRAGTHPGHGRIVVDGEDAVKTRAGIEGRTLTIEAAASLDIAPAALVSRLPDYVANAQRSPDGRRLSLTLKGDMKLVTKASGSLFIADLSAGDAAGGAPQPEPKAEPKAKNEVKPTAAPQDAKAPPPGKVAKPDVIKGALFANRTQEGVVLRVETPGGLAAFHRGPALWLAFGAPVAVDVPALENLSKGHFKNVQRVDAQGGTVLRLTGADAVYPRIAREKDAWVITLGKVRIAPSQSIGLDARDLALLARLPGETDVLQAIDPEMGDRLLIAPVQQAGLGHSGERQLAAAIVLASTQGLAAVALSDGLSLRAGGDQVAVASPAPAQPSKETIFDFAAWRRPELGSVMDGTRALEIAAARAKPAQRTGARLDLARYRFANGFGTDALGLLTLAVREQPLLADDPEIRALRGVARLLAADLNGAREDLAAPALDGIREMALWRALLAAKTGDPSAAIESLAQGLSLLAAYPDSYRARFAIAGAQAALDRSMPEIADQILGSINDIALTGSDQRAVTVLRGRLMAATGREQEAAQVWEAARRVNDPKAFVMSALFDAEAGLRSRRLDAAKAVTLLEPARYAWRGGELELKVLRALAPLYVQTGQERRALDAMRVAMTQFSSHPAAANLAKEMADVFATAFLSEEAERRPVLQSLALYNEFAELTPTGAKGDEVIARLTDRLTKLDLLDQAANLLERQLAATGDADAKLALGTRLAQLRFADGRFADAIQALDAASAKPKDLSPEVAKTRGELRARALAKLDRLDEALALAGDNVSLRLDLAWQAQKWPQAHAACKPALAAVQFEGAKLAETDALTVLRCAVAAVLTGDETAVGAVQAKFGGPMASGPFKNAFAAISAKPQVKDLLPLAAQLGDVAAFKAIAAGQSMAPAPKT